MFFPESYFAAEVREGFEISALMKRCWAAQMEVLEQFDEICKRNGLKYYAADGTLLGAVRHNGFIPWDDDLDIWMFRNDAERLLNGYKDDLSGEDLELSTPFTNPEYRNMVIRVNNTRVFSLEESFLMKYHLFPFTAGLDIFVLDNIPMDATELDEMRYKLGRVVALERKWYDGKEPKKKLRREYVRIAEELEETLLPDDGVICHLWRMMNKISGMYSQTDTEYVGVLTYFFSDPKKRFRKQWFEKTVNMDFEGFGIPCPAEYSKVLESVFGKDYMIPLRMQGDHEYPYYRSRQELLKKFLESKGIPCPSIYM